METLSSGPNQGWNPADQTAPDASPTGADAGAGGTPTMSEAARSTVRAIPPADSGGESPTAEADALIKPGQLIEPGRPILNNKYVVVRELGRGGMGVVWLIRHVFLGVEHALKVITRNIALDPQSRARFRREARVMAQFTHRNAVTVHDSGVGSELAYIIMEHVRGTSLNALLNPVVPMPLAWTTRILTQLCDVLQEAHDLGIVHRDLKPSNLMLIDDRPPGREQLKVIDFGIAKVLQPGFDEIHTQTGCFMGTPQYASPEQVKGAEVDGRSDLYSIGVLLYEILTGHRPFSGPPMKQFLDQMYAPPPSFSERNPNVQGALQSRARGVALLGQGSR